MSTVVCWLIASCRARSTAPTNCREATPMIFGLKACNVGSAIAANMPMIEMTTRSSSKVNARDGRLVTGDG